MDVTGPHARCDAVRLFETAPGATPVWRVLAADGSGLFAARWALDGVAIASGHQTHAIVACRMAGTSTVTRRAAGTSTHRRPPIGAVTYVDAESPATWATDGASDVCHVYLSPAALRRCAESDLGAARLPPIKPLFAFEDPWLKGWFQMLASEFELSAGCGPCADPLFVAQAEHLLIHHLLRWHRADAAAAGALPKPASPLRPAALRHVADYVSAHLGDDIELADLAGVAFLSVGHFVRGFRAAAGTTPYRYVLEQRLGRARELLRSTDLPVARIASACGFKTPSHLAAKFRARVGVSPTQYRGAS